jgi:DNA-binding transcriptional ArsR family regulator
MTDIRRRRMTTAALGHAAPVFAALGDETRLKLVARLGSAGPQSIAQLAEGSDVTRQAITKHLLVLDEAGLVHSERRGRERIWEFDVGRLLEARRFLDDVSVQWDRALHRLKEFVEE